MARKHRDKVHNLKELADCQTSLAVARKERDEAWAKAKAYIKECEDAERIAKEKQERYRLDVLRYKPRGW
jgi:hypothetical protein